MGAVRETTGGTRSHRAAWTVPPSEQTSAPQQSFYSIPTPQVLPLVCCHASSSVRFFFFSHLFALATSEPRAAASALVRLQPVEPGEEAQETGTQEVHRAERAPLATRPPSWRRAPKDRYFHLDRVLPSRAGQTDHFALQ